jgi:hypothetical protein
VCSNIFRFRVSHQLNRTGFESSFTTKAGEKSLLNSFTRWTSCALSTYVRNLNPANQMPNDVWQEKPSISSEICFASTTKSALKGWNIVNGYWKPLLATENLNN